MLAACGDRVRLFFRFVAETGCRKSEGLGLTRRRVGAGRITFAEQLADDGTLAQPKTRRSRRTIEVTRGLAAELQLAAGERVFGLDHDAVDYAWSKALKAAGLADPQPVIHDLRHTHVSGLIADGWDVAEIAARIGDSIETTLRVYSHAFDARRRGQQRRDALEARYGGGDGDPKARDGDQQTVTDRDGATVDLAQARAARDAAQ